jgi:hypothetical protein
MVNVARRLALFALVGAAPSCGGGATPTSPSPPAFTTRQSSHFTFRYTAIDESRITRTAAAVEDEYARIAADLGVTSMPTVTVTLYPNVESLRSAVAPLVGPIPAFASGLATAVDAIHIVSPNLPGVNYASGVTNIVHEFGHCVSYAVNPRIANNPRWLWESVALFEARQFDDAATRPFAAGTPPSFARLNTLEDTTIYSVGAWIGRFIVETWDVDRYRALVRTNGDLQGVLGVNEAAFFEQWAAFVRRTMDLDRTTP